MGAPTDLLTIAEVPLLPIGIRKVHTGRARAGPAAIRPARDIVADTARIKRRRRSTERREIEPMLEQDWPEQGHRRGSQHPEMRTLTG